MADADDWLTASELGSYVYCAKQFEHKTRGTRTDRGVHGRRRRGTRAHHRHGVTFDWQKRLRTAGYWLLAVAAAVGAGLVFLSQVGG